MGRKERRFRCSERTRAESDLVGAQGGKKQFPPALRKALNIETVRERQVAGNAP